MVDRSMVVLDCRVNVMDVMLLGIRVMIGKIRGA